jgi:hypothetical protein
MHPQPLRPAIVQRKLPAMRQHNCVGDGAIMTSISAASLNNYQSPLQLLQSALLINYQS